MRKGWEETRIEWLLASSEQAVIYIFIPFLCTRKDKQNYKGTQGSGVQWGTYIQYGAMILVEAIL